MPRKPKLSQNIDYEKFQVRDLFQTPNYATKILIPYIPSSMKTIWECASGDGKITKILRDNGKIVLETDIRNGFESFLQIDSYKCDAIVTNPPYSLKNKFIQRAIDLDIPFAFLIPFDMSGFLVKCFEKYACQGIVPSRRIDYITPTGKSGATGHSSYFHSFWLTRGFCLKKMLEFVDLTKEMKKDI